MPVIPFRTSVDTRSKDSADLNYQSHKSKATDTSLKQKAMVSHTLKELTREGEDAEKEAVYPRELFAVVTSKEERNSELID